MRSRGYLWLPVALSSALLFPSTAIAETIRITSGFFDVGEGSGPYSLVGDRRGFTLTGTISTDFAHFAPICAEPLGCAPGTVARLPHQWTGLDFVGPRLTLDGITYEEVNSLSGNAFASVLFFGDIPLPPFDGNTAVALRTPFRMDGGVTIEPDDGQGEITEDTLVGSGILTTKWARFDSPDLGRPEWALTSARYDFFGSPVPEPTTFLLAGIAGAAAAFGRRKRRAH
jgi:hypothetical protein